MHLINRMNKQAYFIIKVTLCNADLTYLYKIRGNVNRVSNRKLIIFSLLFVNISFVQKVSKTRFVNVYVNM